MPENDRRWLRTDEEYLQLGVKQAQETFLANKHHEQTYDRLVAHPSEPSTHYRLKRIEGEIAFVHHPFPPKSGDNPEKEYQFPLDELYKPADATSAAFHFRSSDEKNRPKLLHALTRFLRDRYGIRI